MLVNGVQYKEHHIALCKGYVLVKNMVINDLMDLIKKLFDGDLYQCYRRSDFKISKELAEKFDRR